jgi:hypothetical protein
MSASMCESPCRSWPRTPHAAAGTARPAAGSPGKRHTPRRPAPPPAGRGRSRSRSPPPRPRRPRPSTGRSARAAEPSRPPPRAAASSPAPYTARPSPPRRDGPPPSHPRRTAAPALPSTMSNHVVSLRENHQRPNEAVLTPGGGHDIPAAINSPGYRQEHDLSAGPKPGRKQCSPAGSHQVPSLPDGGPVKESLGDEPGLLHRVRKFAETEVLPVVNSYR